MATRSYHIMLSDDKKSLVMQYIHYDGYPSARVPILLKHYNNPEKVEELFAHGPASSLNVDGTVNNPYKEDNRIVPIVGDALNGVYLLPIGFMIDRNQMPTEEYHYFWDGARWWLMEDLISVDVYSKKLGITLESNPVSTYVVTVDLDDDDIVDIVTGKVLYVGHDTIIIKNILLDNPTATTSRIDAFLDEHYNETSNEIEILLKGNN